MDCIFILIMLNDNLRSNTISFLLSLNLWSVITDTLYPLQVNCLARLYAWLPMPPGSGGNSDV